MEKEKGTSIFVTAREETQTLCPSNFSGSQNRMDGPRVLSNAIKPRFPPGALNRNARRRRAAAAGTHRRNSDNHPTRLAPDHTSTSAESCGANNANPTGCAVSENIAPVNETKTSNLPSNNPARMNDSGTSAATHAQFVKHFSKANLYASSY